MANGATIPIREDELLSSANDGGHRRYVTARIDARSAKSAFVNLFVFDTDSADVHVDVYWSESADGVIWDDHGTALIAEMDVSKNTLYKPTADITTIRGAWIRFIVEVSEGAATNPVTARVQLSVVTKPF